MLMLALLGSMVATMAQAGEQQPRWSQLEFGASKFFMTARFGVTVHERPAADISQSLLGVPKGQPVAPADSVLELVYRMSGFGRQSSATLWVDPASGASLQQTELDSGRRQRLRDYRFTDLGAWHFSRWPASRAEQALPPAQWTDLGEGLRAFPAAIRGQPVASATTLLWLAAAGDYTQVGDRDEVLVFSRGQVSRVGIEFRGRRSIQVDYQEHGPAGTQQRRGKLEALVLTIRGQPLESTGGDSEFELLGLQGNLELLLDPLTRIPLQLSGMVKIAGQVTVRLQEATLR